MITDRAICDIVAELYGKDPQNFADILWPESDDGVCAALRRINDTDVVVFRGSVTPQDWWRDFTAIPHEFTAHPQLGDVHAGFMDGMDDALAHLFPLLRSNVVVCGHSLGAARAALFTGLLHAATVQVAQTLRTVVFGEPRTGCGTFKALLAPIPYHSYRNAGFGQHDLVCDVPTEPPFSHPRALIDIYAAPAKDDPWGPLRMHHIALYQAAMAVLQP